MLARGKKGSMEVIFKVKLFLELGVHLRRPPALSFATVVPAHDAVYVLMPKGNPKNDVLPESGPK